MSDMPEVDPLVVVAHLDAFARVVQLPRALFAELPWDELALRTRARRLSWDPCAELLDRLGARAGDDRLVERAGALVSDRSVAVALAVDPRRALQVWEQTLPRAWGVLEVATTDHGDGVEAEVRIRDQRGCRTLLLALQARLRSLCEEPGFLETVELTSHLGRWRLRLPPRAIGAWDDLWAFLDTDRGDLGRVLAQLADQDEATRGLHRLGEVAGSVATLPLAEAAALACRFAVEDCGHAAARLSLDVEAVGSFGAVTWPPDAVQELQHGGRVVGRLETWGPPHRGDLLGRLLPWLVGRVAAERDLAEWGTRASDLVAHRSSLAETLGSRATWIVGADGVVEWSNLDGDLELAMDPGLRELLGRCLEQGFERLAAPGGEWVVRRRPGQEELDRRSEQLAARWALSAAQARVLGLVLRGRSNAEVARALTIRSGTVEAHLSQIFRRSGCTTRAQLLCLAWPA